MIERFWQRFQWRVLAWFYPATRKDRRLPKSDGRGGSNGLRGGR